THNVTNADFTNKIVNPSKAVNVGGDTSVAVGDELTYTIAYTNTTSSVINTVTIIDYLDSNVEYISSTVDGNTADPKKDKTTLTWIMGSLDPGATIAVTVIVKVVTVPTNGARTISNYATVNGITTNTVENTVDQITLNVTKTWDDTIYSDLRPSEVTVNLQSGGNNVQDPSGSDVSATLDASNTWTGAFTGLSLNNARNYTVEEEPVTGYTASYEYTYTYQYEDPSGAMAIGTATSLQEVGTNTIIAIAVNITNTLDTTSLSVKKVWEDEEDKYGLRPEKVSVKLQYTYTVPGENCAEDQVVTVLYGDEVELSDTNSWSTTFTGLPAYRKAEGIVYAVTWSAVEMTVLDDYTITYGTAQDGTDTYQITNMLNTGGLAVTKTVVSPDTNTSGSTFTVQVYSEEFAKVAQEAMITASVTNKDGSAAASQESAVTAVADAAAGTTDYYVQYTITDGQTLTLSDIPVGDYMVVESRTTGGYSWITTYSGDGAGVYTVEADDTAEAVITNTITGEARIYITKKWEDFSDKYGTRPLNDGTSFQVTLTPVTAVTDGGNTTYSLNTSGAITTTAVWDTGADSNGWTISLADVPMYDANGCAISYAITETDLSSQYYSMNVTSNGAIGSVTAAGITYATITPANNTRFTITNTLQTVDVTVSKTVLDPDGKTVAAADLKDRFTIALYAYTRSEDGQGGYTYTRAKDTDGEDIVYTYTISAGDSYKFTGLPLGYYWSISEWTPGNAEYYYSSAVQITGAADEGDVYRWYDTTNKRWANSYRYVYLDGTNPTVSIALTNTIESVSLGVDMSAFPAVIKTFSTDALSVDASIEQTFSYIIKSEGTTVAKGTTTVTATNSEDGVGNVTWAYEPGYEDAFFYTETGTYIYEIYEESTQAAGIDYDDTHYTLVISVTLDEDPASASYGSLAASYAIYTDYGTADQKEMMTTDSHGYIAAFFTNTYDPNDTTFTLMMSKTLLGRKLTRGEFSVAIQEYTDDTFAVTEGTTVTAYNTESGDFSHGFTYTAAGDYYYKVTENVPADAVENSDGSWTYNGMTYDVGGLEYYVKVTVGVNASGNALRVTGVSYKTAVNDGWSDYIADYISANNTTPIAFTNSYIAETTTELTASKKLSGRTLVDGEFTFLLEAVSEGAPLPTGEVTADADDTYGVSEGTRYVVASNAADGSIRFGNISYTQAAIGETYTYRVAEVVGTANGMTYDTTTREKLIYVKVEDNQNGTLKLTVTSNGTEDTDGDGVNDIVIRNIFERGTVTISGTKTWVDGETEHDNPQEVELTLYYSTDAGDSWTEYTEKEYTFSWGTSNKDTWTIVNLPQYSVTGEEMTWKVVETAVEGYTTAYDEKDPFAITNTIIQEMVTLTGTKTWIEPTQTEHNNAEELTLLVYRTSAGTNLTPTLVSADEYTVTWDGSAYTITGLDKFDSQGYPYTYSVEESYSADYSSLYADYTGTYTTETDTDGYTVYHFVNTAPDEEPSFTVDKETVSTSAHPEGYVTGEEIQYTVTVTNTGNVTIHDVTLTDELVGASGDNAISVGVLEPGEEYSVSLSYVVTETDVAAGSVTNVVIANAKNPHDEDLPPQTDIVTDPVISFGASDGFTITKIITPESGTVTDEMAEDTFDFTVTGPDDLYKLLQYSGAVVTYQIGSGSTKTAQVNSDDTFTITGVKHGETVTVHTMLPVGSYTVTETSSNGNIYHYEVSITSRTDVGSTSGSTGNTATLTENGTVAFTAINKPATTSVKVTKNWVDGDGNPLEADLIPTDEEIEVTLLGVASSVTGSGNLMLTGSYSAAALLTADSWEYTFENLPLTDGNGNTWMYSVTEETAVAGFTAETTTVTASVNSDGTDGYKAVLVNVKDSENLAEPQKTNDAAVVTVETADGEAQMVTVGTQFTYTITYTNNTNKKADVVITDVLPTGLQYVSSDPKAAVNGQTVTWTIEDVAPFTVGSVTVTVVVTEDALSSGAFDPQITNSATVQVGGEPTQTADDTIEIYNPAWTVDKTVTGMTGEIDQTTGLQKAVVGDTLTYTITIANTGNVTITKPVTDTFTVDGETVDLALSQTAGDGTYDADAKTVTLAAGETVVLTAVYSVGVTDNALVNTVTVGDEDDPDAPTDTVPTEVEDVPALLLVKETTSTPADGEAYALGEVITYKLTLYNLGNTTITDIVVEDALTGNSGDNAWKVDSLAPGESVVFTTSYTVTEADILAGSVVNEATASGSIPSGDVTGDSGEDTTPVPQEDPGEAITEDPTQDPNVMMTVVKETTSTPADGEAYALGEEITYQITVTNVGNLTITDLVVEDELTGNSGDNAWTADSLAPGESVVFTVSHVVTEADVLAGEVVNEASASAIAEYDLEDNQDGEVTPEDPEDGIVVDKTRDDDTPGDSQETETSQTEGDSPQTGDETPVLPYMMLLISAAGALLAGGTYRRRRRRSGT
ncbi:MAG: Cna B-type domain-containing protein, partial [Lachnospiraceae bacterium]|nr:Cna B-type domain-containing protein [Lachnospiraceae bacterium]